jgi:phytoene dehydrogenase-like protein
MKEFDILALGAGWGGLTVASQLAMAGWKVALLEAQDRAGGYGQSFEGDGFTFCAQMQYLMGCGPGGVVNECLGAIGLQEVVLFNSLDTNGYDRIALPGL